jgi:hypothetical protein
MLAFSITAVSLEPTNSGAIIPAEGSVGPPVSAIRGFPVLLSSGVRELNPFATHIIIVRFPGWIRTRPDKGSSVTHATISIRSVALR